MRKPIRKAFSKIRTQVGDVRESLSGNTDAYLLTDIYHYAQKQHLAAPLFSLDEIAIEPKVLTPLIDTPRTLELAPTDSVSMSVPYIPDWPELAAFYNASTMTLTDALQGGVNIILAGHPGSGKTVALAWLASSIARNDKGLGKLSGLLPLYIHATELRNILDPRYKKQETIPESGTAAHGPSARQHQANIKNSSDPADVLIQAISGYATPLTLPRLPRLIHTALANQRAIILLDQVDEFPPGIAKIIVDFIQQLTNKYPGLRIVIAMSYEDLAGLPVLGYKVLSMAAWSEAERSSLLQKWSQQWEKLFPASGKGPSGEVDRRYLASWLRVGNSVLKPLEYTLMVWAAFAGDILGPDGASAIEAYIRRMTLEVKDARQGLEYFALQLLIERDICANPHDTERIISEYEASAISKKTTDQPEPEKLDPVSATKSPPIKELTGTETLASNGFLTSYPGSRFGFSHVVISGYLAGKALAETNLITKIQAQPSWSGRTLAMNYYSRYGDVTPQIQYYLQDDDFLHTNHLLVSRWLQIAPKNRPWRTIILRTLASTLHKEKEARSLAAKAMTAMALSGDEGILIFFRQLLSSDHPYLRQLGALGCGILGDIRAVEDLNSMLQEQSPASIRTASLALAAIGDKQSLEILATNLLNGSELMRRCAAEALANSPKEGYPALQDGSTMEDLLVRRSVVFGLIRVDQPWARKIVENLQLEDGEWVVRNAAIQAFDELHRKANYAPHPLADLTEESWLIDYAGKVGTSIAPGKPAEELVKKALQNGDLSEKLNALDYFRNKCDPETVELIYATYKNSTGELHDAAYHVLWLMSIAGIKLPYLID